MTEMEILLKFVPGQIIGHSLFNVASRWRITMLSYGEDADRLYRIHSQPVRLFGTDRVSVRNCNICGQEGCSVFRQLDMVILYDEEGNTYG